MIGKQPFKIHWDVIEHVDYINASHRLDERFSDEAEALEWAVALSSGGTEAVVYRTEVNAFGVVMGRERVRKV